jgi:hypothetical protein
MIDPKELRTVLLPEAALLLYVNASPGNASNPNGGTQCMVSCS